MDDSIERGAGRTQEKAPEYKSYAYEDLELGMDGSLEKTVSADDVINYAILSGDENPVHLDPAYAKMTPFKEPIAHGMLTASYISAVFGTVMPGPGAIYVSQTLNFKAPVKIGDTVKTTVQVVQLMPKNRVRFECQCLVGGKVVLEGEAVLIVPARPVV